MTVLSQRMAAAYQKDLILKSLQSGPMSTTDLSAKLGLSRTSIACYLKGLMANPRRVRIIDYRSATGMGAKSPLYAIGTGPDAPNPNKRQATPDLFEPSKRESEYRARETQKYCEKAASSQQQWYSALGL